MNGTVSKILVAVSLAVVLTLAIPLGLMTVEVLRGGSPRQLAGIEPAENVPDDAPASPKEEEDIDAVYHYVKPVVEADPGPLPEEEPEPEPESPAPQAAPAPAKKSSTPKKTPAPTPAPAAPRTETAAPKQTLPKAVLAPGEAPCMIDGLDGYSYDYQ